MSESVNPQLRAEIFNMFNRAKFGSPANKLAVFRAP